jgi:hypothetical protein
VQRHLRRWSADGAALERCLLNDCRRVVERRRADVGTVEGNKELASWMSTLTTPQILMLYPCRSLLRQLKDWSEGRGGRHLQISFERSLAGIRRQTRRVDFAVIDATEDPAQAADAYFQSFKILGADSMAVYTEIVHEGLEILVRRLGVAMLLGPMPFPQWDDFFVHRFPRIIPLTTKLVAPQGEKGEPAPDEQHPLKEAYPVKSIAG